MEKIIVDNDNMLEVSKKIFKFLSERKFIVDLGSIEEGNFISKVDIAFEDNLIGLGVLTLSDSILIKCVLMPYSIRPGATVTFFDEEMYVDKFKSIENITALKFKLVTTNKVSAPTSNRILIVVEGGVIQNIVSEEPVEVYVLDYETEGCDNIIELSEGVTILDGAKRPVEVNPEEVEIYVKAIEKGGL